MCRAEAEGGRRCKAHSDPSYKEAYNARRRNRYATSALEKTVTQKLSASTTRTPPTAKETILHRKQNLDFESKLSQEQKDALVGYSEFDYEEIRDYLEGRHVKTGQPLSFDDEQLEEIQKKIELIDSALAEGEAARPRVLYRGLRVNRNIADPEKWVDENFQPGSTFSGPSYMSASLSPLKAVEYSNTVMNDGSRSVIFEIVSKKGVVLGDTTSSFGFGEHEVLLPREETFKVVAVHKKVDYKYDYFAYDGEDVDEWDDPFSEPRTVIQIVSV